MTKKTRVGLIVPEPLSSGGVSSYAEDLVKMSSDDVEWVLILQPIAKGRIDTLPIDSWSRDVATVLLPPRRDVFLSNGAIQVFLRRNLPSICREEHIEIIHSQFGHMPDLLVSMRSLKVPVVSTAHNSSVILSEAIRASGMSLSRMDQTSRFLRFLSPLIGMLEMNYVRSRSLIVPSMWFTRRARIDLHADPSRLFYVPHGIDIDAFKPGSDFGRPREKSTILFLGRVTALKGLDILLSALLELSTRLRFLRLVIAGPGQMSYYEKELNRLRHLGLEIECTGGIIRNRVPALLCSCDVAVYPSFVENAPISIMEAMSCGLTVVASDVGGVPEIVDNTVNGFLFRAGDHLGLAGILLQVLEDENLRKCLGREARRTAVESFDGHLMCSRTVSVYESLLDNR